MRLPLMAIGAVAMWTLGTPALRAQATRTWVSGVGDDANPCSRTAPCKTFAGAISKTAAGGEINVIDPGGYGGVTITKSITINGGGSFASVLVSGTNGIIVNVGSTDVVTIRNVSINGVGAGLSGIKMIGAGSLFVENVDIHQFTDKGIDFQPNGIAQLFRDEYGDPEYSRRDSRQAGCGSVRQLRIFGMQFSNRTCTAFGAEDRSVCFGREVYGRRQHE